MHIIIMVEPEILIRRATKDDYDGVMKISPADLFCGPDYLPDYFYSLLEQPNVVAYVGVIGGKCVGFGFSFVVDNGQTIVLRGGRISKEFQGLGISRKIGVYNIRAILNSKHKHIVGVGGAHVDAVKRIIEMGVVKNVLQMGRRYYQIKLTELQHSKNERIDQNKTHIKAMDITNLEKILSNCNLCKELFPERRFVVDLVPYGLTKENAALILRDRTVGFFTNYTHEVGSDSKVYNLPEKRNINGSINNSDIMSRNRPLLTFGTYFHVPAGCVCNMEFYGHKDDILNHLKAHILNLILHCKTEQLTLQCCFLNDEMCNAVDAVLLRYGFNKTEVWDSAILCHETTVPRFENKL